MSRVSRTGWSRIPVNAKVSALMAANGLPDPWSYQKDVADGHLTVLAGPEPPGFHLSISHRRNDLQPGRYPTWDEIVEARYEFCPGDITMSMLLPPRAEYVNLHETTFHLWELLR